MAWRLISVILSLRGDISHTVSLEKQPYVYIHSRIYRESNPFFHEIHTLIVSWFNCSASVKLFSSSSSSLDLFLSCVSITGQRAGSSCPRGKLNTLLANSYRSKKHLRFKDNVQICCTADFDWSM